MNNYWDKKLIALRAKEVTRHLAQRERDERKQKRWATKAGRLVQELSLMTVMKPRLHTAVANLQELFSSTTYPYCGVCGNPKCTKPAGGRYHPKGVPFGFCSTKCSRIVRAQRFRDKRKAVTKVTPALADGTLVTNVTTTPLAGGHVTKVTKVTKARRAAKPVRGCTISNTSPCET